MGKMLKKLGGKLEQAGAELGQAQLKLRLDFTLILIFDLANQI